MNTNFALQSRESNRDLHVRLTGAFHSTGATELEQLLQERYSGAGRLFLDVRDLHAPEREQHALFRQCLHHVPPGKILFKGELGFQLAGEGSRVLLVKKRSCQCSGACKVCACKERARSRKNG